MRIFAGSGAIPARLVRSDKAPAEGGSAGERLLGEKRLRENS